MQIEFPAELEERLSNMALSAGLSADVLVVQAVEEFVQQNKGRVLPARHLAGGIITPQ